MMDPMQPDMLTEEFRIARPGRVKALGGVLLDVTPEHLQGCVDALNHIIAQGTAAGGTVTYPAGKIDHIDTPNTPILGEFRSLRIDPESGWMIGSFRWASPEAREFGHSRLSRAVSMEIDFDVEVYGKAFPARLVDVALLPAEALPAMPGAGSMRAVASAASTGWRVRLACGEDDEKVPAASTDTGEGDNMDEKMQAAFAQIGEALSGISSAVTALAAKVDAITAKDEAEAKAARDAATAAAAAADSTSMESFTAALSAATTAGKVTQGEAEELATIAKALPVEGRAKLAASFEKRPAPAIPPEKLPNGKEPVKLSAEEKGAEAQKLIRAKLSADPGNYVKAVEAARKERPELFTEDEVK